MSSTNLISSISPIPKASMTTVVGDATDPLGNGLKIIIHCCNNRRKWGRGFVIPLSRKWPKTKSTYMDKDNSMQLGTVSWVKVRDDLLVANIIGQDGYGRNGCYVDYQALESGFELIAGVAEKMKASIHGPKLGSGLAGGDWSIIKTMLQNIFVKHGISVTIYKLKDDLL